MLSRPLLSAWAPMVASAILVFLGCGKGWLPALLIALPAGCIVAGSARSIWLPDTRGAQLLAVGAVLGLALSPFVLASGYDLFAGMLALSVGTFVGSGWLQIRLQPHVPGSPDPPPDLPYAAGIALDNAILGLISLGTPVPARADLDTARDEVEAAYALFRNRGWLGNPAAYHAAMPAPQAVEIGPVEHKRLALRHVSFASGYDPDVAMPGRDRWLAHHANRTVHAHVLNHKNGNAPWVLCVHGAGMGADANMDIKAFHAADWHHRYGYNVALITLPVHGPRSPSKVSGAKFFGTSPLDFIHAETQAIADIRSLLGWIRREGATAIGVFGLSLGAYTSALLSILEDDLAFVLACVPFSDIARLENDLASGLERRLRAAADIDPEKVKALYSVVSPLSARSKVSPDRRFIYAATGDQFAPIEQAVSLWHHWDRPRIHWCKGGHVSAVFRQAQLRGYIEEVARMGA